MDKRVVITGAGVISPIGNNVGDYVNSLRIGKCGVDYITHFDTNEYKTKLACEVKNFDYKEITGLKGDKKIDKFIQYAIAAAKEAKENSGLDINNDNSHEFGVMIGSGIGGLGTIEEEHEKLMTKGVSKVSSFFIPKVITNMAAGNVSIYLGTKGVCQCTVSACASSADAIGMAYLLIKTGRQKAIFAGGTEATITPLGIGGFESMKALSFSVDKNRASIPFDKERSGFVMGEGAGVLVLEELEHAKQRGANILAEIVGYGQSSDAYHITSPDISGDGGRRAMEQAICEADLNGNQIDYINAHGTSTYYNDSIETKAIKLALGNDAANHVWVSSTKSMTGHLLGAAGAVEAIACVYAMKDSFVPPTVNYLVHDEECDLNYTTNGTVEKELNYALSNSLGFGGHNSSLLFKKWNESNVK